MTGGGTCEERRAGPEHIATGGVGVIRGRVEEDISSSFDVEVLRLVVALPSRAGMRIHMLCHLIRYRTCTESRAHRSSLITKARMRAKRERAGEDFLAEQT